jgi:perosamine synthetase
MDRIPVSGPWITQKEIDYVTDAVTNAWYGNANMYYERFESAFAEYIGVEYAISLPSCTSAIHLSLAVLGIGPGDEVIVPDVTWIASSAPVTYVGAEPVFADIDRDSWCLSADSFEECITPRTKAVIPVNIYGNMPEMDAILEIAGRHGIHVVEDAAESIGSEYKGGKSGSFGVTGVFSFHGSKTLTTGEGGMLVTDDRALYERAMVLRDHGRPAGDKMFCNTDIAFKYKMSSMQAALGLAQIERIDDLVDRKREIFRWYADRLEKLDNIAFNTEAAEVKNTYWMVSVIVDGKLGLGKEVLMGLLDEKNIDSRPFFRPLSSIPAYAQMPQAERARQRNTVSYEIAPFGINLPSGLNLDEETVDYVCRSLEAVLQEYRQ